MTKNEQYIIDNKICFVTNSRCTYGTTFLASLQTYVNLIPFQNFWLIPGYNPEKNENTLFYGYRVFLKMLLTLTKNDYYDYVIYIDDDCFINDFDALLKEFEKFKNSDCCLAGTQDGEVLCHRNHSKIFVNTFLSFWNIKMLKNKVNDIINYINMFIKKINCNEYYKIFRDIVDINIYNLLKQKADDSIKNIKLLRNNVFAGNEPPYCNILRYDEEKTIEHHQEPYTSNDDIDTLAEPYYLLEMIMVLLTNKPIYYLCSMDLYDPENKLNIDNSGLTSQVLTSDKEHTLICYHTWFSRGYTIFPALDEEIEHTQRINTVIKYIKECHK